MRRKRNNIYSGIYGEVGELWDMYWKTRLLNNLDNPTQYLYNLITEGKK